ncbi:heterokaryon incompatibility protein-domain-containing protein [Hypoxylon crocopeplum]|nr:heterokaryon incompatibility protein-domain-containing protein [Hypoxylon crocopeplum]
MSSSSSFLYQNCPVALDANPPQFRLVELFPTSEGGDINIRFHAYSLDTAPPFEALSYIWGNPDPRPEAYCDGHPIRVTRNLHNFLLALAGEGARLWLWIDELCINQEDSEEKMKTIQMIPSMFRHARRTMCWTGTPLGTEGSRLLGQLNKLWWEMPKEAKMPPTCDPYHSGSKLSENVLGFLEHRIAGFSREGWQDLDNFLSDRYFQRVWVLPDFVHSSQLRVRHEFGELSWEQLWAALEVCLLYSPQMLQSSQSYVNILAANYMRLVFQRLLPGTLTFNRVLLTTHACGLQATNLIDHIHVIHTIRMFEDDDLDDTELDYRIPVQAFFRRAASRLGLLSLSLTDASSPSLPELESWVPTWGVARKSFLLNDSESRFSASPLQSIHPQPIPTDSGKTIMQVKGLLLDTVKQFSGYLPPRRHCDHYRLSGELGFLFSEWFEFAKENSRSSSTIGQCHDQEILIRFAETLHARGCNSIWEPSEPSDPVHLAEQMRRFLEYLEVEGQEETVEIRWFYGACYPAHNRKFGVTSRNQFCLLPQTALPGDLICIPHGSKVPYVFRRLHDSYQNQGECYVHGFMQGEITTLENTQELMFDLA